MKTYATQKNTNRYCLNFLNCHNLALSDGDFCQECHDRAAQQAQQAWKYEGWTRYDEREAQKNHKGKK